MHVNKTMHKLTDDVASDNINLSTSSRAGIIQWADITIKDASVHHGRQPESAVVAFPSREDIFMCVFAQTGADRRYKETLTSRVSRRRNPIDQSMEGLTPTMNLLRRSTRASNHITTFRTCSNQQVGTGLCGTSVTPMHEDVDLDKTMPGFPSQC